MESSERDLAANRDLKSIYEEIDGFSKERKSEIKRLIRMTEQFPFVVTSIRRQTNALLEAKEKEEKQCAKTIKTVVVGAILIELFVYFFISEPRQFFLILVCFVYVMILAGHTYLNGSFAETKVKMGDSQITRYETEWAIAGLSMSLLSELCVRQIQREREGYFSDFLDDKAFQKDEVTRYRDINIKVLKNCIKATDDSIDRLGLVE